MHSSSLTRSLHSLLGKVIVNQIKSNSSHYAGFLFKSCMESKLYQLKMKKKKITYHFPLREQMIRSHTLDKCGKSLIQPEVVPPFHSDQITKPLKERTANYCNQCLFVREKYLRGLREPHHHNYFSLGTSSQICNANYLKIICILIEQIIHHKPVYF